MLMLNVSSGQQLSCTLGFLPQCFNLITLLLFLLNSIFLSLSAMVWDQSRGFGVLGLSSLSCMCARVQQFPCGMKVLHHSPACHWQFCGICSNQLCRMMPVLAFTICLAITLCHQYSRVMLPCTCCHLEKCDLWGGHFCYFVYTPVISHLPIVVTVELFTRPSCRSKSV